MPSLVDVRNKKIDKDELLARARERLARVHEFRDLGLIPLNGDHMPVIVYPPFPSFRPAETDEIFEGYLPNPDAAHSVYAAFPFCRTRCVFCHLPVQANAPEDVKEKFVGLMIREMDLIRERIGVDKVKTRDVLIGGGTPTFCSSGLLDRYLREMCERLDLSRCDQWNIDLDPLTMLGGKGRERMRILKSYGPQRFTMGIQSFNDGFLKMMNRPHSAREAMDAVEAVKQEGIPIDIELIYGFKGQTVDDWIADMETALSLEADEIQVYRMRYHPYEGGVPSRWTHEFRKGKIGWEMDKTFLMKEIARLMCREAGYGESLARVFKRNPDSKLFSHYASNLCCELEHVFGVGPAAYGRYEDVAVMNTNDLKEYSSRLEAGKLPVYGGVKLGGLDKLHWHAAFPTKGWGKIVKARYKNATGTSLDDVFRTRIAGLVDHGLVADDNDAVRVTELGRFFADELAFTYFPDKYQPFPRSAYAEGELNPFASNDPYS